MLLLGLQATVCDGSHSVVGETRSPGNRFSGAVSWFKLKRKLWLSRQPRKSETVCFRLATWFSRAAMAWVAGLSVAEPFPVPSGGAFPPRRQVLWACSSGHFPLKPACFLLLSPHGERWMPACGEGPGLECALPHPGASPGKKAKVALPCLEMLPWSGLCLSQDASRGLPTVLRKCYFYCPFCY